MWSISQCQNSQTMKTFDCYTLTYFLTFSILIVLLSVLVRCEGLLSYLNLPLLMYTVCICKYICLLLFMNIYNGKCEDILTRELWVLDIVLYFCTVSKCANKKRTSFFFCLKVVFFTFLIPGWNNIGWLFFGITATLIWSVGLRLFTCACFDSKH